MNDRLVARQSTIESSISISIWVYLPMSQSSEFHSSKNRIVDDREKLNLRMVELQYTYKYVYR